MCGKCGAFGGDADAGKTRCVGSEPTEGSRRRLENWGDKYCASSFTGPECKRCVAENHYLVDGVRCEACPPIEREFMGPLLLGLGVCVAFGLAAYLYKKRSWRERRYVGPPLRLADRMVALHSLLGMQAKFKLLLSFYQVVVVIPTIYGVTLPEEYTKWIDAITDVISPSNWVPMPCVTYTQLLLPYVFTPLGLVGVLLLVGVGMGFKTWFAHPAPRPKPYRAVASGLLEVLPVCLILVYCVVPPINAYIFRFWRCKLYTVSPPDEPLRQVEFLVEDNSIECGTDEYDSIFRRYIIVSIVIWPVGSMVLYSSLLVACYKPLLRANLCTALTWSTAFLHQDYETQWCWWEALELARRLVLTGAVTAIIPEERAFLRLVLATLISTLHTCGIAVARPFKRVEDDVLAVVRQTHTHARARTCPSPPTHFCPAPLAQATSLLTLLIFLAGNWIFIFDGIVDNYYGADPLDVLGFGELNGIVTVMLSLIFSVLVLFLIGAVVAARKVSQVPTFRLVSTNQPPELTLALGLTWHLFNSHIWGTGQDAVAVIKKQLMLLLPGIQVFLDVRTQTG